MKFTRKDLLFSIITGFITGFSAWMILSYLGRPSIFGYSFVWLLLVVPVLWISGVNLGFFLGRWIGFFNQFGKFAAIGFTNAAVDFAILNLLIAFSGITAGIFYSVFKVASFIVAMTHSYIWNKYWAFEAGESHGGGVEFAKFFMVTLLSLVVNVITASVVVNFINPVYGLDAKTWANVGAVVGSALALMFSFVGMRMAVFKRTATPPDNNLSS